MFLENPSIASYDAIVAAPFGAVGVRLNQAQTHVQSLEYLSSNVSELAPETALAQHVCEQVLAFIADPNFQFDLPLLAQGTPFQNKVWQTIRGLESGKY